MSTRISFRVKFANDQAAWAAFARLALLEGAVIYCIEPANDIESSWALIDCRWNTALLLQKNFELSQTEANTFYRARNGVWCVELPGGQIRRVAD